ncbi:alpha/beta fold hydrolase [Kitasatospora sp. NBC_01560]|uniref:alpha/beta hydrolase n=1 Tax=Kitasatospora sp. NBC_01560 TaxID=2975965 RepID=UPI0038667F6A
MPDGKTPVMFVHGLWLHSTSWQPWAERFEAAGYRPVMPEWPGVPDTVAAARQDPDAQAGTGLAEISRHLAEFAATLDSRPILIGHSVGGFLVEKLLGDGIGRAAIAISPGQIKGVKAIGTNQVRSTFAFLSNPANRNRTVSLSAEQFRHGFANAVPQDESDELFEKWTIPSTARPLFQLALSNLEPHSPAAVNTGNESRGPLLLMAAKLDQTVDQVLVHSAFKQYRHSGAVTELMDYDDRGHSLTVDSGAPRLIDDSLAWLAAHDLR